MCKSKNMRSNRWSKLSDQMFVDAGGAQQECTQQTFVSIEATGLDGWTELSQLGTSWVRWVF